LLATIQKEGTIVLKPQTPFNQWESSLYQMLLSDTNEFI